jgi:hypothetical protein
MGDMLKAAIYKYVPARGGVVTAADTVLDGSTAGYTYHQSDRPASAFTLTEEHVGSVIMFENYDTSDGINSAVRIWGYPHKGPAEFIADLSLTAGTARIDDVTTNLYTDTITRVNDLSDGHIKKIKITDSGNDRVAKVWFDNVGYGHLYVEVYDLTTSAKISPMIRPW